MDDLFIKIINKQLPAYIIYQDKLATAFLDVHPINKGHVLVVPNQKVLKLQDLDNTTYLYIMNLAHLVSLKIDQVFQPPRVAIVVEGFEVPHAHIHVFPAFKASDLHKKPSQKLSLDDQEMREIQQKIMITSL